ncbi:hypothetical protein Kpho01_32370 [Kitasatospora phosalacinea]|uniref:Uncharacterized protein n=1 Tax=Kitasatospora phosalacinea TaxID=2065 RepID=A0A9W6UM94_9ACTN|nr:hypothetical protein Kpho01_32370 [Kitasatospora phosalacinea]
MDGRRIRDQEAADPPPPWRPGLGDLAYDTAVRMVGVVVEVPGDGVYAYHLSPPAGGSEWTAERGGSTLRPVNTKADDGA